MSIDVCLISRMDINYKENSGMKNFSWKFEHQYRSFQCGKHDCRANNKKNRDYYE